MNKELGSNFDSGPQYADTSALRTNFFSVDDTDLWLFLSPGERWLVQAELARQRGLRQLELAQRYLESIGEGTG